MSSKSKSKTSKPAASSAAPAIKPQQARAAALAVLGKVAATELVRSDLPGGCAHAANLAISGDVDGQPIKPLLIIGVLNVGHDAMRASSQAPNFSNVVAYLLSRMTAANRDALLRELPGLFVQHAGELPVDAAIVNATAALLGRLRATTQTAVRGAVSCKYTCKDS